MSQLEELTLKAVFVGPFGEFLASGRVNGLNVDVSKGNGSAVEIRGLGRSPRSLIVEVSKSQPGMHERVMVTRMGTGDQPVMQTTLAPDNLFPGGLLVSTTVKNGQPICRVEAPGQSGELIVRFGKGVGGDINIRQGR